ncbi:MAG: cytochrome c [Deltaproteobacteria bacterium]|nr:cytochrome c [Deltaproteobacteria bacterium]
MKREATYRFRLLFASAWLALIPAVSFAADSANAAKAAYLQYCSACHGEGGKGDGVVSQLMRPKPTDLTVLAKENNGEFPFAKVMASIDGRQTLRAHGDPNMPVWGEIFKADTGASMAGEGAIRGKVLLITDHLKSIQQK